MAFFSIFRHKPLESSTPLPEPEPQPTKFCKDCKHYDGAFTRKCNNTEAVSKRNVSLVDGPGRDYAEVNRRYGKCGLEGTLWEPWEPRV